SSCSRCAPIYFCICKCWPGTAALSRRLSGVGAARRPYSENARKGQRIETECTRRADSLVRDMRFQLLSFVVLCSGTSLFGAVEKPFNFYETPGKLPKQVVPTDYSVRFVPNIENFTFAGSEMVKLNDHSPIRQLVLNAF